MSNLTSYSAVIQGILWFRKWKCEQRGIWRLSKTILTRNIRKEAEFSMKLSMNFRNLSCPESCVSENKGRDLLLIEGKGGFGGIQKLILIPTLIKEEPVLHTASARLPWHHQLLLLPSSISARILPEPRGDQGGGQGAGRGLFSFQTEVFYKLQILQLFLQLLGNNLIPSVCT